MAFVVYADRSAVMLVHDGGGKSEREIALETRPAPDRWVARSGKALFNHLFGKMAPFRHPQAPTIQAFPYNVG